MIKKILVGVLAFAVFMTLARDTADAGKTLHTFGSAVGGGAKMVAVDFVPAVFDALTGSAPAKGGPGTTGAPGRQ